VKYVIVDLEAACWRAERPEDAARVAEYQHEHSEIIEIGAVKLGGKDATDDEFDSFVKPTIVPTLSDFCMKLTTISQEDVDTAPIFPVVFADFVSGLEDVESTILCSWGQYDWDMLKKECDRYGIVFPFVHHVNVKERFMQKYGGKHVGVQKALRKLGMIKELRKLGLTFTFTGIPHRGIDDARNIVTIFKALGG